ncbi:MAG: CBS domain-containing protein [bacterium]
MSNDVNLNELVERCGDLGKKKVKEVMSRDIVTVREDSKFIEFVTNIEMYDYVAFPVLDEKDELVGIVSQTDLLKLISFHRHSEAMMLATDAFLGIPSIRAIMTTRPITLSPDDTVGDAVQLMVKYGIQSIPIVEEKHVIGMMVKKDIIQQILSLMGL